MIRHPIAALMVLGCAGGEAPDPLPSLSTSPGFDATPSADVPPRGAPDEGVPPVTDTVVVPDPSQPPPDVFPTAATWTFDDAGTSGLPDGFRVILGTWSVVADAGATSAPNVLRQTQEVAADAFPRVVIDGRTWSDLRASVRCRPETGSLDRSCGLMFRVQFNKDDNYYLVRANALEGTVRLFRVIAGKRQPLATGNALVGTGEWHTLEVTAVGTSLSARWDGKEVLATKDDMYASGRIGLWTQADSVTAFDDLTVEEQ